MNIEISTDEMKVIQAALDAWEAAPIHEAGMTGMLEAIFVGKDGEKAKGSGVRGHFERGQLEGVRRKRMATMLRAKLYQAEAAYLDGPHAVEIGGGE